ncbi:MAG TPA: RodZ domain-containing protein [Terriglobales bacterium]|nr:RodZ domain-containing protein [Terriglobales bacterium]
MESFGTRLKHEREMKGVSLDDISLSTKIGIRLLRALEEEHFEQLPGGIFNKGFVRAYARYVGLDEEQAVADYLAASGDAPASQVIEPEVAQALETRAEERGNGIAQIPWGVLATALVVVAIGFAIWGFYLSEKEKPREAAAQAGRPETEQAAPAPAPAAPAPSNLAAANPIPEAVAPPAATAESAALAGEFVVLIKADDDSWMSIIADGQRLMEGTMVAGSERSIHAQKFIAIRAGNVGALGFFFNGKKLPSQGDTGEVKLLSFNAQGLEPPKPATPSTETTPPPE